MQNVGKHLDTDFYPPRSQGYTTKTKDKIIDERESRSETKEKALSEEVGTLTALAVGSSGQSPQEWIPSNSWN